LDPVIVDAVILTAVMAPFANFTVVTAELANLADVIELSAGGVIGMAAIAEAVSFFKDSVAFCSLFPAIVLDAIFRLVTELSASLAEVIDESAGAPEGIAAMAEAVSFFNEIVEYAIFLPVTALSASLDVVMDESGIPPPVAAQVNPPPVSLVNA